jgi:hypothetical protein
LVDDNKGTWYFYPEIYSAWLWNLPMIWNSFIC